MSGRPASVLSPRDDQSFTVAYSSLWRADASLQVSLHASRQRFVRTACTPPRQYLHRVDRALGRSNCSLWTSGCYPPCADGAEPGPRGLPNLRSQPSHPTRIDRRGVAPRAAMADLGAAQSGGRCHLPFRMAWSRRDRRWTDSRTPLAARRGLSSAVGSAFRHAELDGTISDR